MTAIPVLRACPPRKWPWHERLFVTCACCKAAMEFFVERCEALAESFVRTQSVAAAISHEGWILMKDRAGRADWLCVECARFVPDRGAPIHREALQRRAAWSAIEYSIAPGVRS